MNKLLAIALSVPLSAIAIFLYFKHGNNTNGNLIFLLFFIFINTIASLLATCDSKYMIFYKIIFQLFFLLSLLAFKFLDYI